ncbi:MAG: type I polyketide synthase, partial [Cyanobacteria bacterium P01_F01_bin.86]
SLTANFKDCLSSKVSSILNLKGPSVSIQTDCSTSLVAIHMASLSLAIGECDMALACGVSLQVPERADVSYQDGSAVQGTVFSGGAGIVILKRLADAIADRDYIYAVIKGTAINHNGFKHPSNQTTPSVAAQTAVISKAQSIAGVAPETISYIETDAAVTELGNSVEMAALTQAFTTSAHRKGVCAVGSLRTSLGHLGAATGVASLIKVVLALKHKQIPPSLNWEQSSSQIDSSSSPFYINTELSPWETDASRNAGVSSFSRGGTNVYMVLEEAPIAEISEADRPWQLLVLSAKTSSALEKATVNLAEHLKQHPNLSLANAAYTLQIGRQVFDHRKMLVCQSLDDAVTVLESPDSQNPPKARRKFTRYQPPCHRPIVFMFSGQGTQYLNMARELYEVEVIFREIVDTCSDLLRPHLGLDLRRILYPEPEQFEEVSQQLKQTAITQPALFVIEYALAKLWMKWGIEPVATIGHSIGEYVAATLAGVFSLEDALALVSARGQLMQQLPSGSMLAVALPEEEVRSFLSSPLSIAAVNAPSMCTVSGATDAIEALQSELDSQEVDYRPLHTSHAFHSEMMEPILSSFSERVKQVPRKPPQIPYVSNITGTWITPEEAVDPEYWASHIRQTVRFSQGLQELFKVPNQVLLEVGPGQALSKLAKRHKSQVKSQIVLNSVRHPREQCSDEAFLLKTLGHLWLVGVTVDWSEFYASKQLYRLPLPTYPFEDQRYQIEQQKKSHLEQQNETSLSAAHP